MHKGFTLIELLVAILIVGILSTVAVSSYMDYTRRAQRADAKAVLMELAGWMERNYTASGSYILDATGNAIAAPPDGLAQSPKSGTSRYAISLTNLAATTFTAQAVPANGWTDSECGTLTLDHIGTQGKSGTSSVADCWQR